MGKSRTAKVLFHVFLSAFGVIMIYPILWTLASSLKPESQIFVHAASLIPSPIVWKNYLDGWTGYGNTGFNVFFRNSAIVTFLVVIGTLFSSSVVAFGFARLKFRFRNILFVCLMITMMLPMQVTLIPQYILFQKLGWVNTWAPLIVPAYIGGNAFFVFLVMQFIRGIPRELDEAATIDGCGIYRVFWKIIFPLMTPALVTVGVFSFYWTWDDFFGPLIYLNHTSLYTAALGLSMFSDPSNVSAWGPMFAMSVLSLIPELIVFFFFQKQIVQGISMEGLKG